MHPRQIAIKELIANGYVLKRQGGDHMIFFDPVTKTTIPIKRSTFNDYSLQVIRSEIKRARKKAGS